MAMLAKALYSLTGGLGFESPQHPPLSLFCDLFHTFDFCPSGRAPAGPRMGNAVPDGTVCGLLSLPQGQKRKEFFKGCSEA